MTDPRGAPEIVPLSRIERIAARRLSEAKTTIPEIVLRVSVDMSAVMELRQELRADVVGEGGGPTVNDIVIRACALALRVHPRVNSSWAESEIAIHSRVNIGIAVANGADLVVPTVFDADRRSLDEIGRETRRLIGAVRSRKLTLDDLSGATFTVTNLGMYGVDDFNAIINPPQAAILAVGAIRAEDSDGRRPMSLSLTCDHRILSGVFGAKFLAEIAELLRDPARLTDHGLASGPGA
jgi:pyruvate dehydrogenase E2 component (dihydrolipoamide acetyltransferase)